MRRSPLDRRIRRLDVLSCGIGPVSRQRPDVLDAFDRLEAASGDQPLTPARIPEVVAEERTAFDRRRAEKAHQSELLGAFDRLAGAPDPTKFATADGYAAAFEAYLRGPS